MSRLVNKIVKEELKELLGNRDFIQLKSKLFVRIRDDLVDVISIEMGRYGTTIYLNYFINLLPSISPEDLLTGSYLGDKVARNDEDNFAWSTGEPETEEHTRKSIKSIQKLLNRHIIPWFDNIKTIEDYIVEHYLILAKSRRREITDFSNDFYFSLIGKDYQHFLTILDGVWSPCLDTDILHQLIHKTNSIPKNREWIENLRNQTMKLNKL